MNNQGPSPEVLKWATPARLVGPAILIAIFLGFTFAALLALNGRMGVAILAGLGAITLALVGLADLLAELIAIGRRIEKALESKLQ